MGNCSSLGSHLRGNASAAAFPLAQSSSLPNALPPPTHRGKAHLKKGFCTERSASVFSRTDKTDGRGNRPLPQVAAPQNTPAASMPVSLTKIPQQRPPLWLGVLPPLNLFRPTAQGEQPVPKGRVHWKERAHFPIVSAGQMGGRQSLSKGFNKLPSSGPEPPHPLAPSHSRHTGRATRPSKGDLVPGGVSIFPSRLDRAGGRGGRLTRDDHPRKKSSAVAFPQPGAPLSTRVKSPTPLRGKGS